jgi:hypothetical protein
MLPQLDDPRIVYAFGLARRAMRVTDQEGEVMDAASTEANCRNCGAPLQGPFCYACGQKAAATHLALREIVHEAADEFLHFDGKILKTLKVLVLNPGKLTRDLVEGHRVRYVSPLRLYLMFSVLYFFLFSVVPGAREAGIRVTRTEGAVTTAAPPEMYEKFANQMAERLPHVGLTLAMPAFAGLTFLFYRCRQPFFISHLYYSLHTHSFMFLAMSVSTLGIPLGRAGTIVGGAVAVTIVGYYFLSQSHFFGESRLKTLLKGVAIAVLYIGVLAASMIVVVMTVLRGGG